MRIPLPSIALALAGLACGDAAAQAGRGAAGTRDGAQDADKPGAKPVVYDMRSSRLIKLLELPEHRSAAVRGLLQIGSTAARDLGRAMSDPRPQVVHTVAHILHTLGPAALPAAPLLEIRARDADPGLAFPAQWALSGIRPRGVLLIASSGAGKIVELDADGAETFSLGNLPTCFDAERLPNGNYLVACFTKNLVVEITREGKEVWRYAQADKPMDVDRLPNGNTLIAGIGGKVVEVDRKGTTVWSHPTKSSYEADRLPDGNTLISEYSGNGVKEVTPSGTVVWSYPCPQPMDADRLPNGNTLIVLYGTGVREVTPDGKIVLQFATRSAYDITRLPSGEMLIAGNGGLGKYDATGKQIWHKLYRTVGSIQVY